MASLQLAAFLQVILRYKKTSLLTRVHIRNIFGDKKARAGQIY